MRSVCSPRALIGALLLIAPVVPAPAFAQAKKPAAAAAPDSTALARLKAERDEDPNPAPARKEGEGPFQRLIIRGVHLIDGYGSAPRGPVDVIVEGNRIAQIVSVAALGIVTNLIVMVVTRGREISILRAMGASGRMIRTIFVLEGVAVGVGLAGGVALALKDALPVPEGLAP